MTEYVASLSGGKDSLAMVLRIMEEKMPLTKCVMYDTGVEFGAIYRVLDKARPVLESYGCELVILKPDVHFLLSMLARPVCKGEEGYHHGYDWCGGRTRWGTRQKVDKIEAYLKGLGPCVQYVGIAADEGHRVLDRGKRYPLVEWRMTEADCLAYCRSRGWHWREGDVDLYDVLDRVSCWCCANKNLKELRNMRESLPDYWEMLKGLQSRIDRPYRRDGATVFDLDRRFELESRQMALF